MQQAIRPGQMIHREPAMAAPDTIGQREDDLGFMAALRIAVPAGLAIWGALIFALVRFLA